MANSITTKELEEKLSRKEAALIDVLGQKHFEREHISGAINIPLENLGKTALERFDRGKSLVVYCKDRECDASDKAVKKLEKLGFENVKDYEPGLEGWKKAGNQVSSSEP
ncbi:rhodanese-like domain-containing protein [Candidatus Nanohalococcus occultus]|uniref:rhodanese-like domain-containing protein n=1 Tax=Candidatus Nanohalococcus occultus TaxID=2978047 RepID=UPI0039E11918